MKRFTQQRPSVSVILIGASILLLAVGWRIGNSLYSDWVERNRVKSLTQQHRDDLLEAVERYRIALAVSSYVDRDELDQYATGSALLSLQRVWDEMQTGEEIIVLTSLDYSSIQVFSYTENMAKLLIMVRWKEVVNRSNSLEFADQGAAGGWVRYVLQFEDGVWKVRELDACPVHDRVCVNQLRSE